MITSEYVVLRGAKALALPTIKGQHLSVDEQDDADETIVYWKAKDHKGDVWMEATLKGIEMELAHDRFGNASNLSDLLRYCASLKPQFFSGKELTVETSLEFPWDWGLGSSATLFANLGKWLEIDPTTLLWHSHRGSGYDVITSREGTPVVYTMLEDEDGQRSYHFESVTWDPPFSELIHFVHLGQKQNSEREIGLYEKEQLSSCVHADFDAITEEVLTAKGIREFDFLIRTHEKILSALLGRVRVKDELFPDFPGEIKSLGAWGGDFVMATGTQDDMNYFKEKGFSTILSYEQMIG